MIVNSANFDIYFKLVAISSILSRKRNVEKSINQRFNDKRSKFEGYIDFPTHYDVARRCESLSTPSPDPNFTIGMHCKCKIYSHLRR